MIMMPRNRIEVAELQRRSKRIAHQHLCHTLTLRIQRLKFGCEQLTKGPDMIRYTCRQCWRALSPAGTKRTGAYALVQWPRLSQAHVWSRHMIEGLEEDHALPQALAVFPEAGGLPGQRGQGLPQRQVHPFDQGRAEREAQGCQALGSKYDARAERPQLALGLLCDQWPIDQRRMGLRAGLVWAPLLAGTRKRGHDVERSDQGRQRAREAVAEAPRDSRDARLGGGHDLCGGVERTWPHDGRDLLWPVDFTDLHVARL